MKPAGVRRLWAAGGREAARAAMQLRRAATWPVGSPHASTAVPEVGDRRRAGVSRGRGGGAQLLLLHPLGLRRGAHAGQPARSACRGCAQQHPRSAGQGAGRELEWPL